MTTAIALRSRLSSRLPGSTHRMHVPHATRAFTRHASTKSGPSGPSRGLYAGLGAAACLAGSLYMLPGTSNDDPNLLASLLGRQIALDARLTPSELEREERERPSVLWTPPTRKEMISALKASSLVAAALPGKGTNDGKTPAASHQQQAQTGEEGYDLLIIGGGATGSGVALDAASRGLKVAMVERDDWSAGTSSKSTKLVHGGVRYLQKAVFELDYEQWKLVKEALHERKTFLEIAPYLSSHLPIMLPIYKWWQVPYFWSGCKLYDLLAGRENMESSYLMSRGKALEAFPMLKQDDLVGALVYYDGQHNDARMNMALVMTAVHQGCVAANHTEVVSLHRQKDANGVERLCGARLRDNISKEEWDVKAKGIINATGPFSDGIRKLDDPTVETIVSPSAGVHVTLPKYYSPGKMGLIDPATSDGRVIFFLPWLGNTIAGTTDSPSEVEQHPLPKEEEIQWILGEVRNYLSPDIKVRRGDVLSAWSGLRPLVRNPAAKNSESLVRNHMINVSDSGLLTIAGGKWTTYRAMAEETVDAAVEAFGLQASVQRPCRTEKLKLLGSHGWHKNLYIRLVQQFGLETEVANHLTDTYGDRAWAVCSMAESTGHRWPVHGNRLDPAYPYLEEEVLYGVRVEYAQTATDVIARRTRLSFLNAHAALEALPRIIDLMAPELGWDKKRQRKEFEVAQKFLASMGLPESELKLSLEDVRNGAVARMTNEENAVTSRNMFSVNELSRLRKIFDSCDSNGDGQISSTDMRQALNKIGFSNVPRETIEEIISEVHFGSKGAVELSEFLDAVSGIKELSAENAFNNFLGAFGDAESSTDQAALGQSAQETSNRSWFRRRIPVEKSGGGV
ncbi:uncharacterized protein L969DRAFT_548382 [Mixia osmundae IAM 14324]|uniref:Glycerol-3-phosphate dehydrogenase n=1 Tax=Mixia osmundae (strain CBS 9802 / IAM 14324 / JCM 22182 / KY 12970) TaxID=764103 RepID=G7E833_MIXOS|nr:uncharacterized protein L969DRAFT_548382 [Mixia osmundae IAM 14324]KEI38593.1 hypothetical protein L969DRAFT_548382 [Mixia osmundae IAM 14324]GAA98993.1 hypothetical protein E5Q_05682 [Mixia osmundae IAM 14324]